MHCGTEHFHKTFHHELMAKPEYQALSFELRGVLFTCRNLAGAANNCGGIRIGREWVDLDGLVRWLVKAAPGMSSKRCRTLVVRLIDCGFIIQKKSGRLVMGRWAEDHTKPPSIEARWQRESRARRRSGSVQTEGPAGGCAPRPPASSSTDSTPSASSSTEPDMSGRQNLTCQEESKRKIEEKDRREDFDSIRPPAAPPRQAPSAGGRGAQPADPAPDPDIRRIDVYDRSIPLVALACRVCCEGGSWSRNGFAQLVAECDEEVLRSAMAEVMEARQRGVKPKPGKSGYGGLLRSIAVRISREMGR